MKKTPLRKASKKQSARLRKYAVVRKEHLDEHPYCIACYDEGTIRFANEVHHALGRLGDLLFDRRYFKSMCEYHGSKVHRDVTWAKDRGYSGNRY